eukprot:TRINITY_DN7470_c0_g1_i6.p1 TRINITY_DN7470_c0_g1~~TRINITY_DN7470_c0_g1_i6.p1  ORF type:complete len:260 (-),score=30.66 TRINITY_DN7470_c0_g1_i6:91-870(-)
MIGVKQVFRHLDATLPKYMMRSLSCDVTFGTLYALNPLLVIIMVPIFTSWSSGTSCFHSILLGSALIASSVFVFIFGASYYTAIGYVFLLSLGESLSSPRLTEYSASIAPEGREGTYLSMSQAPLFAAKLLGGTSGYLLSEFCPCHRSSCEPCCPFTLQAGQQPCARGVWVWMIVGFIASACAFSLFFFRNYLNQDFSATDHHEPSSFTHEESELLIADDSKNDGSNSSAPDSPPATGAPSQAIPLSSLTLESITNQNN